MVNLQVIISTFLIVDIPSPNRKKSSTSTAEDCVVPDIDDEDNVFNFEQPRVPPGLYTSYFELIEFPRILRLCLVFLVHFFFFFLHCCVEVQCTCWILLLMYDSY